MSRQDAACIISPMCGRFAQRRSTARIREEFGITSMHPNFCSHYNVSPGQAVLLGRIGDDNQVRIDSWLWGFVPRWAKDTKPGPINARAETVHQKPMFRYAFQSQRCLIPADNWYEWAIEDGRKQPYALEPAKQICFAGICEQASSTLASCAIITTEAAPEIRHIHDRMPAIIERQDYEQWLRGSPDEALGLLRPYEGDVRYWRISTYVNRPANNDERCLAPI